MSSSIYSRLKKNYPIRNKYKAVKQKVAGRSFDSGFERKVYDYLKILELTGAIKFVKQQSTIEFEPHKIKYRADFEILEKLDNGEWGRVLVEAKGGNYMSELQPWKNNLKMYRNYGPCPLWLFKDCDHGGTPRLSEIVVPKYRAEYEEFLEKIKALNR